MLKKIIIVWYLFAFCASVAIANTEPTEQQIAKLESGEIILTSVPQQTGTRFQAWVMFPASIDEVRNVLEDFENYPKFMPEVELTEILSNNPDIVNYTLGLPLGIKKRYRLLHEVKTENDKMILSWQQISWPGVMLEDSIKDTKGFWRLSSHSANQTLVYYDIYTDPGNIPFGFGWIVDYLSKESVPDVLRNTKAYLIDREFRK